MPSFDELKEKSFLSFEEVICGLRGGLCVPATDYRFDEIHGLKGNFYIAYPFLFASQYENVDQGAIEKLTLAGNLYFAYLLLFDELFDGDTNSSSILVAHVIHECALDLLYEMFPTQSSFWNLFKKHKGEFIGSLSREREAIIAGKDFGQGEYKDLITNKGSFAKCATAGLWVLSGGKGDQDIFDKTQDLFHAGLQLLDDLQDWKDDFRKKRPSYLLSLVLADPQIQEALKTRQSDPCGVLGRGIYYSGIAERLVETSRNFFVEALQSCKPFYLPEWKLLVESYIQKTFNMYNDLKETRLWLLEKREKVRRIHSTAFEPLVAAKGQNSGTFYNAVLAKGLWYLQLEQRYNYPEMAHRMALPNLEEPGLVGGITVVNSLFQRAIVLDSFIDLRNLSNDIDFAEIISNEISFLEKSRLKSIRGGWSYFPGYPWLPPDTDDLAQITQALVKIGYPRIKELIDDPIALLIESNRLPDGTFRTWILDPHDNGKIQKVLRESVTTIWGDRCGKDIEVTANMLYALSIYDREKYRAIIEKGSMSVSEAQTPDGIWKSIWYWGIFYGTYVATRLLALTKTRVDCLHTTKEFFINKQFPDGGWGNRKSDPLNTALAILSLMDMEAAGCDIDHGIVDQAISYLTHNQNPEGCWGQVPFIKMFIGQKEITYQSKTITTAFVLKALAKAMTDYTDGKCSSSVKSDATAQSAA